MIKTVFIDWYQTLSTSKFWSHLEDSTHHHHTIVEPLRRTLFIEQNHVFEDWLVGRLSSEQIMQLLADHTGIPYEKVWQEFIAGFEYQSLVSDEILPMVELLRQRNIKVVIATDNMDCFNRWCVPALALDSHFDGVLNSFYIGHLKKEVVGGRALFFHDYLQQQGIGPGESIIFDDSPNLVHATRAAGIDYRQIEAGTGLLPELKRFCEGL